jgi:hypothetical protein
VTTRFEIHPSVGIARVGTSEKSFIGPEPGQPPPVSNRDEEGALLRQTARLRVFECERDDHHRLVSAGEVTPDDGAITRTVHLVNRKATGKFDGVQRNADDPDPSQLVIDPGPRSVTGPGQRARFAEDLWIQNRHYRRETRWPAAPFWASRHRQQDNTTTI